jgi:hypothetical protein
MYVAHIEATMYDDQTAQDLSQDSDWLAALWPEAVSQAENAGRSVSGDPVFHSYTKLGQTPDGGVFDFRFDVPTS